MITTYFNYLLASYKLKKEQIEKATNVDLDNMLILLLLLLMLAFLISTDKEV